MIVEIGMVVGLKSRRSCEWSCEGRAWCSSGREELLVGLQPDDPDQPRSLDRALSGNLGDRVDLIGGENLAYNRPLDLYCVELDVKLLLLLYY